MEAIVQIGNHKSKNSINRIAVNFLRQQRRASVKDNKISRASTPNITELEVASLSHWKLKLAEMPRIPIPAIKKIAIKKEATPLYRPSQSPQSHKLARDKIIRVINRVKFSDVEEGGDSICLTIPHIP